VLRRVQDELFTVAAQLALPEGNSGRDWGIAGIGAEAVAALEKDIDYCEGELTPLREFILPGGAVAAALLHVARTVARRAERACVALARVDAVDSNVLSYMNRLSDLCFVLARLVNARAGQAEAHPTFGR
jgi:cob(I)alamin adenosyltransferase